MNIKHVAHITSAHNRYDTRIFLKECTSLAANDFKVSLVVADGKGDEQKNNVAIYDVGASKGRLDRIRNAPKRVLQKAIVLDADIYQLHDPELIPIGLRLKKLGKKVVFDIHENTDLQILTKEWIPFCLRKIISWSYCKFESLTLPKFDYLIVPQISMKDKFSKYAKTEIIANFPSETINHIKRNNLDKYSLLYSGGLGEARGLFNMLDLMENLVKKDERYCLKLAGPISKKDFEKAKSHPGWKNTSYLGVLNKDEIYKEYSNSSIGLILFNNVGQYYMSYSLKLFEYMQSGMLIVMPDFGDWITFNKENDVGFNVDINRVDLIAEKVDQLTNQQLQYYSQHNMILAKNTFAWKTQEDKLLNLYREMLSDS